MHNLFLIRLGKAKYKVKINNHAKSSKCHTPVEKLATVGHHHWQSMLMILKHFRILQCLVNLEEFLGMILKRLNYTKKVKYSKFTKKHLFRG